MLVPYPMRITSRLEAGLTIPGAGTLSVISLGNAQFAYRIEDVNGHTLEYGEDMRCPCATDYGEPMRTLLSFLVAAAEAMRWYPDDSENSDLFAPEVMEWAAHNSDELSMAELEMSDEFSDESA